MATLGTVAAVSAWDALVVTALIWLALTIGGVLVMIVGALYQVFLDRYEN